MWLNFQDVTNKALRSTVDDVEFDKWLQREPPGQKRGVEESPPHTLHLIQKMEERGHWTETQDEEDPEVKRMVDRARLVTAAQYYVKDGSEGLVEIGGE